jgi:hypothetical protein
MYSVADISILNGSEVADTICDIQSIRQGCPLSMHLFALYIEPLLVRLSHVLQGIRVFDQKLTVKAFVDDVTLFLSCDDDVVKAGEVLDLFCQWTRARTNKKKTKALGLGNWKHQSQWPLPWLESPSTLSLLGIKFSPSIVETADRVWKDAFGYLHGILRESAFRRFTLYQRVNFIKTRALSRTVCIAQILQCNSQMAYRILSVVMNYIWMGKVERPQRSDVYDLSIRGVWECYMLVYFIVHCFFAPYTKFKPVPKAQNVVFSSSILDVISSPYHPR